MSFLKEVKAIADAEFSKKSVLNEINMVIIRYRLWFLIRKPN